MKPGSSSTYERLNVAELAVRPACTTDAMLDYLDRLRDSGSVNMFGVAPLLVAEYGLSEAEARQVLAHWMVTFKVRRQAAPWRTRQETVP